jgi:hypothetical protein
MSGERGEGGVRGRRAGGVRGGGEQGAGCSSREWHDSCLPNKGLGGRLKEVLKIKKEIKQKNNKKYCLATMQSASMPGGHKEMSSILADQ